MNSVATELQTTTHSSSHKRGVDSVGARSRYRPNPRTALRQSYNKYNVADSDTRDQMRNEISESAEVGPISGRTRTKKVMTSSTGRRPASATLLCDSDNNVTYCNWTLRRTYKISSFLSSVLFFSRPRSEGWPHHGRTFSIYPCPLSF